MTAQWILNDIWNEGYEDGRRDEYWMVYTIGGEEFDAYMEGFEAGQRARKRACMEIAA